MPYPGYTPTTVACTDEFEPDNYPWLANPIAVNGPPQSHTFSTPNDYDWVTFNTVGGTTYLMQTANLTGGAQTDLLLTDANGVLITRANHGSDGTASITWTAPQNGAVKLLILPPLGSPYGCSVAYTIQVTTVGP